MDAINGPGVEALVRTAVFSLLALAAPFSSAYAQDTQAVIAAIESKYTGVTAMSASFVQTTHNPAFGDEKQSGSVVLKRPKQMAWDFGDKQFITDGKTMWVYNATDKQVIRYDDFGGAGGGSADQLLTSLDKLDDLFVVTQLPDTSGHSFDLMPKKNEAQVKKVHLEISKDLVVEKVLIVDAFDTTTDLSFTNVQLNVTVPDSKFTFTPPPGTEVISAGGVQ